jgi:ribosomal protein L9
VAEGLRKSGFSVKKEQIQMKSIKEPGTYAVTVVFKHGIEAGLTLHVLVS